MRSLNKNTVELNIARVFAALAVGILFWHVTGPAANHFGYQLDPRAGILVGLLTAAGTWFASRKFILVLQQTEDAMKIPTSATVPAYLHNAGLKKGKTDSIAGPSCPTGKCTEPADKCTSCSDLQEEPQPDGSVKVTIAVAGLSKREFNNLRARIEDAKNVPNTKWEFPKNNSGTRTMTGLVQPGNSQKQALLKLKELTGKRV